ncbi:MAG TPA: orotidine-5'-phosphate decarboxylase [Candidatus Wirthbacteria bacterium]|nr:orotidine-5'-phosphate decarboxylase [Candidatus Wirthbacteria bacterium]
MNFTAKLENITKQNNSLVCVGLDSEIAKMPEHIQNLDDPQFEFNKAIIDATLDLVCAYKPNIAFYETEGIKGLESLKKTIDYLPKDIPIVLDAKRGDIGNTSLMYAKSYFEYFGVDAVTVHGYMGTDTVAPFLKYEEKAIFVLVKTSNPSAVELEDVPTDNGQPVYLRMAELVAKWNRDFPGTAGAVVGATYPEDLKPIREILPTAPLFIPGLGKQGGDAEKTIKFGIDANQAGVLINNSRGIIFASLGLDFADKAREACLTFRDELNSYR